MPCTKWKLMRNLTAIGQVLIINIVITTNGLNLGLWQHHKHLLLDLVFITSGQFIDSFI